MLNFHADTPKQVQDILTHLNMSKERVRLYYGDPVTGKSWLDEHDIYGTIGRSTGNVKVPLLIYDSRSISGAHILDHCIIRIDTKYRTLYKHPNFHTCEFAQHDNDVYTVHNGIEMIHARLDSSASATRYIAWLTGKRFSR
jgi:hypothetical protein